MRGGAGAQCANRCILAAALAIMAFDAYSAPSDAVPARLRFSGRNWTVVNDAEPRGPGPNLFDGRNAYVDGEGRLVLETALRDGIWTSAHVFLTKSLGYGRYELELAPMEKKLDDLCVFGFFTWDEDPAFANREIDVEIARWGIPQAPNLNFTVQPWDGHPERSAVFEFDPSEGATLGFDWSPGDVRFFAVSGGKSAAWSFPDPSGPSPAPFGVPPKGKEKVGINLWLFGGRPPAAPDRVVIERFVFTPRAGR